MQFLEHVYLLASGKMGFDWTHPSDCNVYLLDGGNECALIDTGTGESVAHTVEQFKALGLSGKTLKYIFLTHLHADHAGGALEIREALGGQVVVWKESVGILEAGDEKAIDLDRARAAGFYPSDYRFKACKVDVPLDDGQTFQVGSLAVRALLTPGHSRLDTSFIVETPQGHASLFAGDTVFIGGKISMIHTHDFDLHALEKSMNRLKQERIDSLFSGHLQPAICNAMEHITQAATCFTQLQVPPNIF